MPSNDRAGIALRQPRDKAERTGVARTCCSSLGITMPMVVDDLDDRVGHAYSGMPDRLYVLDRAGKVAYKGGRGPFGFNAREMEQALAMLLLDQETKPATPAPAPTPGRTALPEDADAWKRLPAAEKGGHQPLPSWARALAGSLPRTTAAMLELDYLQRAHNPLDPKLRAKMRWVAARANRCAYGEAYAAADLRRLGVDAAALSALAGDFADLPLTERAALTFARKLTLAADTVTDEEMAALVKLHGEKQVVGMVVLLAYANFQDRLLLALGVPVESGGPLPPLDVRFPRAAIPPAPSSARKPDDAPAPAAVAKVSDPDWTGLNLADLQKELEKQKARPPRVPVPSWEEVRKGLPPDYPADRPSRVRWTLVCLGYQPELSAAWLRTMRTFGEEAKQDRVFEESLFWVITRSLRCFY